MLQIYTRTLILKCDFNFIKITLWHGCYSVHLLHIIMKPFYKNTHGWQLLNLHSNINQASDTKKITNCVTQRRKKEKLVILHKKWSFPLRISSVNVTKSAVFCGFGHIYLRNPYLKISFFRRKEQILKYPNEQ